MTLWEMKKFYGELLMGFKVGEIGVFSPNVGAEGDKNGCFGDFKCRGTNKSSQAQGN